MVHTRSIDIESTRWGEQHARMIRWHSRLAQANRDDVVEQVDEFYAFFICCYHLKDWIKNDEHLESSVRNRVEAFVNQSDALSLAGDITNGFKHLKRDDARARIDPSAHVSAIGGHLDSFQLDVDVFDLGIVVAGELEVEL